MKPFRLDVELRSPLAGGDIPTLDAVLLGELARMQPDADDYARPSDADADNPALAALEPLLKITEGIPHASALLFDGRGAAGSTAKITGRRRELWEVGPLQLHKRGKAFHASEPIYKNSDVNRFGFRTIRGAWFFGVGDVRAIRRALSFWQGVGAQWRNGWGELAGGEGVGWDIEEFPRNAKVEEWWGLVDKNRAPVRPLPAALFRKLGGDAGFPVRWRRVAPPYWKASAPRVSAVVPMTGTVPASAPMAENTSDNSLDFLLDRFARHLRPADGELKTAEKTGGKIAALRAAIEPQVYSHREDGKNKTRLDGGHSLFVAVGERAKLFSPAAPQVKDGDGFESFAALKRNSAAWQREVYDAAMAETDGLCAVIEFPYHKMLPAEDIHVFSGRSDAAALSGVNGGWFSRAVIRNILEIADRANLSLPRLELIGRVERVRRNRDATEGKAAQWAQGERKRRKLDADESPDLREMADDWMERERQNIGKRQKTELAKNDMFDLREQLADLSPAGWAVLRCAPRFRKKDEEEQDK